MQEKTGKDKERKIIVGNRRKKIKQVYERA